MIFHALDKLMHLHDGYRRSFVINRMELLLIQEQGQRHLVQGTCPHLHWPLEQAIIDGQTITCQKHAFAFNLLSGVIVSDIKQSCPSLMIHTIDYQDNLIGIYL